MIGREAAWCLLTEFLIVESDGTAIETNLRTSAVAKPPRYVAL
jgi:hypothetical protein